MKKSLICALLALAVACCGTALYAQDNMSQSGTPQEHRMPPSADQRLDHMTKMLNLTPDQQQKIKPILENEQSQMQALHQDTTTPQADRMAKARELRQSSNQQINGILTPDQQQKWSQMQSKRGGAMGQRGGAMGQQPPPPQ